MLTVIGIVLLVAVFGILISQRSWKNKILDKTYNEYAEKPRSYSVVLNQNNNNLINKIIVNVGESLTSFSNEEITIENVKLSLVQDKNVIIPLSKVYLCNIDGELIESTNEATHIVLELEDKNFTYDKKEFLICGKLIGEDISLCDDVFISK